MKKTLPTGDDAQYVLEPLCEREDFALLRGRRRDSQAAVLGVAVAERASAPRFDRLDHEYSLAAELDSGWAARPITLSRYRNRVVLILEDPGGQPLDQLIEHQRGKPLDLRRYLRIAVSLAAALGEVHRRGLIHKDIKPANVLADDSGHVWLTGFGIASYLPRHRSLAKAPEHLDGTLAYMAPEQTGRIDRSVDSRSDLYSLGVTLYELFTGTLPFTVSDPAEWVHCHIARVPDSPRQRAPNLPPAVSDIIMKLLAKTPEERFQTATGVANDLQRCLIAWEKDGRVDDFRLGEYDQPHQLRIPDKLYGRTPELRFLQACCDRALNGNGTELVLIAGYSGVGKSALVEELQRSLKGSGAQFGVGKFEQRNRGIPHATIGQALQDLVRQVLSRNEAELQSWQAALSDAVGANGALLTSLIPALELILGQRPPVDDLPPRDAQRRFRLVLGRFIRAFGRRCRPLVLFLDDLQWADAETLDLLEDLLADTEAGHLLLIGAYRDNEVADSHPLACKLDELRRRGVVRDIFLAPLPEDELEHLVSDALRCDPTRADSLVQLLQAKTGGNPFFAIQFLQTLQEEELLFFEHDRAEWCWDLPRIHAKGYSDNVADLMVATLNRLPAETSEVLRLLACVGFRARATVLAAVCRISLGELHERLLEAVRIGLVLRSEDSYAFGHDRIHEAVQSLIPAAARAGIHLEIGQLLLAQMPADLREEMIFDIVSQFNCGLALIVAPDERKRIAELNLTAGKRALNATDYATALTYFAAGRSLLCEFSWAQQYTLTFEFEMRIAECRLLTGDLAGAEQTLTMLAGHAVSRVDQAAVACLQVDLFIVSARPERALETGLGFLRRVGFLLSTHPTDEMVREAYDQIWRRLGTRQVEELIELPMMVEPDRRSTMDVLNKLVLSALYLSPKLHQLLIAHMVNLSIEYGNCAASCVGYVSLGRVLVAEFEDYSTALRFGRLSIDLVRKCGLNAFAARVYFSFGAGISSWTQHLRHGLELLTQALEEARRIGDLPYIGYCHSNIVGNLISSGAPLSEVDLKATQGLGFALQTGSRVAATFLIGQLRLIRDLRGLPCNFESLDGETFDPIHFERSLSGGSHVTDDIYWWRRMQALVFASDYDAALKIAVLPKQSLHLPTPNIETAEYHFYAALARARAIGVATSGIEDLNAIRAHQLQLQTWAEHCPDNFEGRAALVSAELARLEGDILEAERLYARAARSARTQNFVQIEALACEMAASFYEVRDLEDIAQMFLVRARDNYAKWGADAKVRQLESRYEWLAHAGLHSHSAPSTWPQQPLDVAAIVKASQTLSREMQLPRLIEQLMRIAVENAGAERGILMLIRDGEPHVEAEAVTHSGNIEVRHASPSPLDLPQSVLHYAMRTQERVLLEDASSDNIYSNDEYVQKRRSRSILCLPIVKQTRLVGALYLENNLTSGAFTPNRVSVLELLASQASISLENAALYTDLQRSEAFMAQGQSVGHTGSFGWNLESGEFYWSKELYTILEYDRGIQPGYERIVERSHPDERDDVRRMLDTAMREGREFDSAHRLIMPDGRTKHVQFTGRAMSTGNLDFVGSVIDVTQRVRAEEQLRQVQNDLAHVARVATLNAMTASITHEVSQPLSGILTNASTCESMLEMDPPDLAGAIATARRTIRDANRASEVIMRLRAMFRKTHPSMERLDLNEAAREVFILLAGELRRRRVLLETDFAKDLPGVRADRVQLQQVILNLLLNAADAMVTIADRPRTILVRTRAHDEGGVQVDVQDAGIGVDPAAVDKLFEAFYTTKQNGMGVGLSICRSIVESHHGRLWVTANDSFGATFSFYIPTAPAVSGAPIESATTSGSASATSRAR